MVRRQTVWLSTMMVLSLMLIGYYTMNNGEPGGSPNGPSLSTVNSTTPNGTTQSGTGALSAMSGGVAGGNASVSDVLVNDQTQVQDELSKRQSMDLKVIDNSNASSDTIQNASQDLQQVNALIAGISNAESAVESQGFSNSAVVPTPNGNGAVVYVQANTLTPLKAAEILDSVSQNTGIPAENIHVKALSSKS